MKMSIYTGRTELPPIESDVSVRLLEGVIVTGVVTGHGQKDGKPTFDFEYDHRTPEGQILKASKWAWPEQVQRNLPDTKDTKQGFLDSAGTFYPSIESVRTYMPAGRTIVPASDPLGEVDEKPTVVMWTRETATAYLHSLEPTFAAMEMTAKIVGSVANKGKSDKDLDVVLQPWPGITMTTECGLIEIYKHLIPQMVEGEMPEPLESNIPEPSWFVNCGTRDGRTVEFYLPESSFPNVHPEELGLSKR